MANFFYICDFLHISPKEFFDTDSEDPEKIRNITEQLKLLDEYQIDIIASLISSLLGKR